MTRPRGARRERLLIASLPIAGLLVGSLALFFAPRPHAPVAAPAGAPPAPVAAGPSAAAAAPAAAGAATASTAGPGDRVALAVGDGGPAAIAAAQPAPVTEHEFYRQLLATARAGRGVLEQQVDAILATGPDCRRVAMLRALHDAGSPAAAATFARAIAALPARGTGDAESVPAFAVAFLAARAAREPAALRVLADVAFATPAPLPADLRRRAAAGWAAAAGAAELACLPAALFDNADELLVDGVVAALSTNPHTVAVEGALARLGRQRAAMDRTEASR